MPAQQQTYEIQAPNGKTLSITGDHVPTESELHDIFAKAGVETGAKREPHMSAAIPGTAYSTDTAGAIAQLNNGVLDPTTRERTQTFLTTPLAHPTGIPPVDSLTSPIGLVGTAASAATIYKALTGPAVSAVGRAVAVARAAGHEITPTLKYEITKSALLAMGIPAPIAYGAATLLSGYRGNGKRVSPLDEAPPTAEGFDRYMPNTSGATAAAPTAIPPESVSGGTPPPGGPPIVAAPVESPVAAPAATGPATPPPTSRRGVAAAPPVEPPVAAPTAPAAASPAAAPPSPHGDTVGLSAAQRTKGQMSTPWIQSDLGMAARRQGLTLSPAEYSAAEAAVRDHDVSPAQAVQAVGKLQTQGPPAPSKLKFSADESTQFDLLRRSGKSGAEAEAAILKLRTLAKKLKTPSGQQVSDAVQKRNETGRWDE